MPPLNKTIDWEANLLIKALPPIERLLYWINERENVRYGKERLCSPKPWTPDPILQGYRFCNVRREDDKVTRWIAEHWRNSHVQCEHLWFALVVARLINWPETLAEIGFPVPHPHLGVWHKKKFVGACAERQKRKQKVFTGAYMIHADAHHGGTKAEYLAERVLDPLWNDRLKFLNVLQWNANLGGFFKLLREYRDMGEFMCGQVIADLKYVAPLSLAKDWWTWATPGPGSRRGMNRLLGRPVDAKWTVTEWQEELAKLLPEVNKFVKPKLHAQDLQNCLCEFDKYNRVLFGEGKPRSKYSGV